MAYCVRCGVKLEPGSVECPLCQTQVIASAEIIGQRGTPLFPPTPSNGKDKDEHLRVDKRRRGFIELTAAFMGIAIVTLAIAGFAIDGNTFSPILPIGCVSLGGCYVLALLLGKPEYTRIASTYAVITIILLVFIDFFDRQLGWSYYCVASIGLFWGALVLPFMLKRRKVLYGALAAIVSCVLFLFIIDTLDGGIAWFLPIALPTFLTVLVGLLVYSIRFRKKEVQVGESVLGIVLIACIGVGSGDFYTLRFFGDERWLSWSTNVWIAAACVLVFLVASHSIRKVRFYFSNKISH
ncbi:MAG: DUF6320 domain-containing protein [Sphaerochaetaceae bacterium]